MTNNIISWITNISLCLLGFYFVFLKIPWLLNVELIHGLSVLACLVLQLFYISGVVQHLPRLAELVLVWRASTAVCSPYR